MAMQNTMFEEIQAATSKYEEEKHIFQHISARMTLFLSIRWCVIYNNIYYKRHTTCHIWGTQGIDAH